MRHSNFFSPNIVLIIEEARDFVEKVKMFGMNGGH